MGKGRCELLSAISFMQIYKAWSVSTIFQSTFNLFCMYFNWQSSWQSRQNIEMRTQNSLPYSPQHIYQQSTIYQIPTSSRSNCVCYCVHLSYYYRVLKMYFIRTTRKMPGSEIISLVCNTNIFWNSVYFFQFLIFLVLFKDSGTEKSNKRIWNRCSTQLSFCHLF